jgi:aarF domain-containing kinase
MLRLVTRSSSSARSHRSFHPRQILSKLYGTRERRNILQKGLLATTAVGISAYALVNTYDALQLDDPVIHKDKFYYQNLVVPYVTPAVQLINGYTRFIRTLGVGYVIGMDYFIDYYRATTTNEQEMQDRKHALHERNAQRILRLFEKQGGFFVKMGQQFVTLRGFLPDEYPDTLQVLQDRVPYLDMKQVEQVFMREFGKTSSELFSEFTPVPIAATSLAQVHYARTKDGIPVAVKVQYPTVSFYLRGDLLAQRVINDILSYLYSTSSFNNGLDKAIIQELDFQHEAKNAKRTKQNFTRPDVYIPKIYDDLSTSRVLTMEFIDSAVKANDVKGIEKMGLSTKQVAQILNEAFAEMIFEHGFMHGDVHAANVFVRKIPGSKNSAQVVFLDHGLYSELSKSFREGYARFWKAVVMQDTETMKQYCNSLGIMNYNLYTMMVTMQTLDFDEREFTEKKQNPKEFAERIADSKEWEEYMKPEYQEAWKNVMNNTPKEMYIIVRAGNLLRAINADLGFPVNRFAINARVADRVIGKKQDEGKFIQWWSNVMFETRLRLYAVVAWFLQLFIKFKMAQ